MGKTCFFLYASYTYSSSKIRVGWQKNLRTKILVRFFKPFQNLGTDFIGQRLEY